MRKYLLLACSAMVFGASSIASTSVFADTKTDDSTNTYTPSDQYNEKLHQKPVANDANSGSDMSTTKDQSSSHKKHKMDKSKKKDATVTELPAGTAN